MDKELYLRPDLLTYRAAQAVCFLFAAAIFRRKFIRNEIKHAEGPYVVVANHQCALDFVNLIGATKRRMSFVISNSFYNSLPVNGILKRLGVIPKQQFQTAVSDMKKIKAVIKNGEPLVIYPAGLMCEDGLSTPIPEATYKFLKWLDTDVYAARTTGTYFSMPKWSKGLRRGRTFLDIYKLIERELLSSLSADEIRGLVEGALLFDAYEEQDKLRIKYKNGDNIEGLENVLYQCPCCGKEFTMRVRDKSTIYCTDCGFEEQSDEYQLLHNISGKGPELRYASEWSRLISERLKAYIKNDPDFTMSAKTAIHMIDFRKHSFHEVGSGVIELSRKRISLTGTVNGEKVELSLPTAKLPTLPFGPGKYLELQHGQDIYRCVLEDGKPVMKFINALKIFSAMNSARV